MKSILIQSLLLSCILISNAQIPVYLNPAAPLEERVNDLISRMTLAEKVSQMQYSAPAIRRLQIAEYNWSSEGLHGVAFNGLATSFPQAIGLAATWNRQLLYQVASTIGDEGRAKYNIAISKGEHGNHQGLTFWSPVINIFRDPRWGRGQESYGEDPCLTGQMAVQFIRGMQGDDPRYYKVIATAKHFAVHSGPERIRHKMKTNVSDYDLWETYLPAFKASVTDGKAGSLMCAYNSLNGHACCGNDPLLGGILRNDWGFKGYVVSDCGAIRDIVFWHHQAPGGAEASALAVKAGTDLNCGSMYAHLEEAVSKGLISEASIDTSVKRLFTARMKLGMFDPPSLVPYSKLGPADVDSKKHRELALKAACESIVLLKNAQNILPLKKDINTIAVIGPDASDTVTLLGNYNGMPSHTITPLEGIRNAVSATTKVLYEPGCALAAKTLTLDKMAKSAIEAAKKADVVVLCMGISPKLEGEQKSLRIKGFWGGDRTSLNLPGTQEELIKKIVALGKPVVLVLINGSALSINWENEHIPAIVESWYGGEEAGTALARVLFGDYNPSGRLPVTFYQSVNQLPNFKDYNMKGRTYRYFNGPVLYPFGYGLSYTNFNLGQPEVEGSVTKDEPAKVKLEVKNTGGEEGQEVIELYVKGKGTNGNDAIKTLRGFEKVSLQPGEAKEVEFTITPAMLTFYETGAGFTLEKGGHILQLGTSSAVQDLKEVKVEVE